MTTIDEDPLLGRITTNPAIFGGKPIIRGQRLAVEHVIGMLAAGDTPETLLAGYAWLEPEDIRACLAYAYRMLKQEQRAPVLLERQDMEDALKLKRLREAIQAGFDAAEAGNYIELNGEKEIEAYVKRLGQEARALVQQRGS